MKNFYDEKYKEKLISEIKKNINHFKIKSENENAIWGQYLIFSFLLILKDKIGKLNINDITDNELYNMYHTKSYGLKPPSIGGISM